MVAHVAQTRQTLLIASSWNHFAGSEEGRRGGSHGPHAEMLAVQDKRDLQRDAKPPGAPGVWLRPLPSIRPALFLVFIALMSLISVRFISYLMPKREPKCQD